MGRHRRPRPPGRGRTDRPGAAPGGGGPGAGEAGLNPEVLLPELPEVETQRAAVEAGALHRTVRTVSLRPEGMLEGTSESTVRDALRGHRLTGAGRHGKHLFVRSGEPRGRWLRLHLGMSGRIVVYDRADQAEPDHTRLRLDLEGDTSLAFRCPRKFGEIGLVDSPDAFVEAEGLGPDPTREGFGLPDFRDVLEGRRGGVKATLLDQRVLAGLGNVYTDEALFQAGLHPRTPVDELSAETVATLWRAVRRVLDRAVEYRADPARMPRTWLRSHREDGARCPRCDGTIRRSKVAGRTTYACDRHQG